MTPRLTPRQNLILTFIRTHIREHGYPPSVREIASHAGVTSTSSIHHHLTVLVDKGCLRRAHNRSRALVVIEPQPTERTAA